MLPSTSNFIPFSEDSLHYLLVNGDTAYRHPIFSLPPLLDSSAPYHLDGSANFVTFVFPSTSFVDTSYVSSGLPKITDPALDDTLSKTSEAVFHYQLNNANYFTFQITDSNNFFKQQYDTAIGTNIFPASELDSLRSGTVWADLTAFGIIEPGPSSVTHQGGYDVSRYLEIDRIVAYDLK